MRKKGEFRDCTICNKKKYFYQSQLKLGQGKFCSMACKGKGNIGFIPWNKGKRRGKYQKCIVCDIKKYYSPSSLKRGGRTFCSLHCKSIWYSKNKWRGENNPNRIKRKMGKDSHNWKGGQVLKLCLYCKKMFFVWPYKLKLGEGKYCSPQCHGFEQRGSKSPVWKGGINPLYKQIRSTYQYRVWQFTNLKLDNFTCQKCGKIGHGNLNVDHYPLSFAQLLVIYDIKNVEDAIACEALWDINNGRTLCEDCHKKTPTYSKPVSEHWQYPEDYFNDKFLL